MKFSPILTPGLPTAVTTAHRHLFPFAFTWSPQAIMALVAGILVLFRPKWFNWIVALYLILVGLLGIVHLKW